MIGPTREKLDVCCISPMQMSDFLLQVGQLGQEQVEEIIELRAAYINCDRIESDRELKAGDTLRAHLRPRRFPVEQIEWEKRILNETADFIAIDKPVNIPVHPTCDNAVDNVIFQLQKHLGVPLWVVHRLDFETAGVMVLAKSKEYANHLRELFETRQMEKVYLCRVEKSVECGDYIHYINSKGLAPYVCSDTEGPGLKYCELSVLTCEEDPEEKLYNLTILLKTGRHHQIRAQLSYLGNPIVGDTVYGSKTYGLPFDTPLLVQTRLAKRKALPFGPSIVFGSIDRRLCGGLSSRLESDLTL